MGTNASCGQKIIICLQYVYFTYQFDIDMINKGEKMST